MKHELIYSHYLHILNSEEFENLKIIFTITTPICLTSPWISLDGLIMHLLARLVLDQDYYTLPSNDPLQILQNIPLPFDFIEDVPLSSVFLISQQSIIDSKVFTIYKRFQENYSDFIQTTKKKIDINRGAFKNYNLQLPTILQKEIIVFCKGKRKTIELLLDQLTFLGKKSDIGFGLINSFKIESNSNTNIKNIINLENNTALRPLPIQYCQNYNSFYYLAYKSPYWNRNNVTKCVQVGDYCELDNSFRSQLL